MWRSSRTVLQGRGHAVSSQNPTAISLVIDTDSLKTAIKKMQQRQKDKPRSTRDDYKIISPLIAYVRPNTGSGNPRSHPLKPKTRYCCASEVPRRSPSEFQ